MADTDNDTDDAAAKAPRPLFQTPRLPRNPLFREQTPAPAPAPATSPHAADAADTLYVAAAAIQESNAAQAADLHRLCEAVEDGLRLLTKAARHGVNHSFSLSASNPYTLDTRDYAHSYLLLAATQTVTFDIPGVGSFTRSLSADWNRLDYPSGTRIYLATEPTSPVNALLRVTDELINV